MFGSLWLVPPSACGRRPEAELARTLPLPPCVSLGGTYLHNITKVTATEERIPAGYLLHVGNQAFGGPANFRREGHIRRTRLPSQVRRIRPSAIAAAGRLRRSLPLSMCMGFRRVSRRRSVRTVHAQVKAMKPGWSRSASSMRPPLRDVLQTRPHLVASLGNQVSSSAARRKPGLL